MYFVWNLDYNLMLVFYQLSLLRSIIGFLLCFDAPLFMPYIGSMCFVPNKHITALFYSLKLGLGPNVSTTPLRQRGFR